MAPKEDIPCIWYHSVKDEVIRLNSFYQYIPGYTEEQVDYMLAEIAKWKTEVSDDEELVAMLDEYYADIRDNTKIDIPWQNTTASELDVVRRN